VWYGVVRLASSDPDYYAALSSGETQFGLFKRCDEIMYDGSRKVSCQGWTSHASWRAAAGLAVIGAVCLIPAIWFTIKARIISRNLSLAMTAAFVAGTFPCCCCCRTISLQYIIPHCAWFCLACFRCV
jgi:hypothetical protein